MLKRAETNLRGCSRTVIVKDSCHGNGGDQWGSVLSVLTILRDVSMTASMNSKIALLTSPISPISMKMRAKECNVFANAPNITRGHLEC
jgi:hypothetical protein